MSKVKQRTGAAWKWVLGSLVGLLLVAGAGYVAAYFVAGNQLPRNASVDGVAVGGLSPAQAVQKLSAELEPRYAAPIALVAPGVDGAAVAPLDSGVVLDFDAAVSAAGGGFSWAPAHIWNSLTGGRAISLPLEIDEAALRAAVETEAPRFAVDPVDATLAFKEGAIARTPAVDGRALDVERTAGLVAAAVREHHGSVDAVVTVTEPEVTDAKVDEAIESFAAPVLSGPVTIKAGDGSFEVAPQQIAEVTTMSFVKGDFRPTTDADKLMELTTESRAALKLPRTRNASYTLKDGKIVVVPSVDGETVDAKGLATAVLEAAVKQGADRVASVATVREKAKFDTAAAEKVAPNQVIGEFTTYYPHAAYRNNNLGRAASSVNGTVLLPGDTFSLNDTLGPRTPANGYVEGFVINGGRLVKESGGGISQSATTLFNAAMFAGMEDVFHKPHSLYFDRYPAGREATIYYGSFDMSFRNWGDYPVYIQGFINKSSSGKKGSITFRMWSRPTWDKVVVTDATKSGFYSGGTRTIPAGQKCDPQAPIQGFTAKWSRTFYKGGEAVKREHFTWKYDAGDKIICG